MFKVGDRVEMPGVPFIVTVEALGECADASCTDRTTFRFKDPESGEWDWMHCSEFVKVEE